jgi:hypothetical protein
VVHSVVYRPWLLADGCFTIFAQASITSAPSPKSSAADTSRRSRVQRCRRTESFYCMWTTAPHVLCSLSVLYLTFTAQYLIIAALCYLRAHKTHTAPRSVCMRRSLICVSCKCPPSPTTTPHRYINLRCVPSYHPQFYIYALGGRFIGVILQVMRWGADFLLAGGKRSASVWLMPLVNLLFLFYFHLVYEKSIHIFLTVSKQSLGHWGWGAFLPDPCSSTVNNINNKFQPKYLKTLSKSK